MKSNVIPLHRASPKRQRVAAHPIPERLSLAQVEALHRRAKTWGFSMEEVYFATITVRLWASGRGTKADRCDWLAVIINSMRLGWGLRGFKQWADRRSLSTRGRPITDARVKELLDLLESRGYE